MKIIAASFIALLAATPALAQEAPVAAPVGPRVEVRVGWDRPVATAELNNDVVTYSGRAGKSGVSYGGEIGYDMMVGGFGTIGAYAGIDGSSINDCANYSATGRFCGKLGRNITAGVRVGHMFSPNGLLYGKVGYSNGSITLSNSDAALPDDDFRGRLTRDGFHLGAGVEMGLSQNVYGKLEYVYTNYNGIEADGGKLDADRHQVVAGVGVRF
jgi:outer membrane immunogenic protein